MIYWGKPTFLKKVGFPQTPFPKNTSGMINLG